MFKNLATHLLAAAAGIFGPTMHRMAEMEACELSRMPIISNVNKAFETHHMCMGALVIDEASPTHEGHTPTTSKETCYDSYQIWLDALKGRMLLFLEVLKADADMERRRQIACGKKSKVLEKLSDEIMDMAKLRNTLRVEYADAAAAESAALGELVVQCAMGSRLEVWELACLGVFDQPEFDSGKAEL